MYLLWNKKELVIANKEKSWNLVYKIFKHKNIIRVLEKRKNLNKK